MTVWVVQQVLTPEEEDHLQESNELKLPFDGLPDLSAVANHWECTRLLQMLHPDDPPEKIAMHLDRVWRQYSELHKGDIMVVPLKYRNELLLAEVTGYYRYQVNADGADVHSIPVSWFDKRIPLRALSKYKELLDERAGPMYELANEKARIAIRDHLPYSYNRFAGWKWLLTLIFILAEIAYLARLVH